jgi:hypothetical protein
MGGRSLRDRADMSPGTWVPAPLSPKAECTAIHFILCLQNKHLLSCVKLPSPACPLVVPGMSRGGSTCLHSLLGLWVAGCLEHKF